MEDIRWITSELRLFFDKDMELYIVTKMEYNKYYYADLNIIISIAGDEKTAIEKALYKISKKNEELTNILNKIQKSFIECPDIVDIHQSLIYDTENVVIETDEETIKFDKLIHDKEQNCFVPLIFKTKKDKK
jgi:hypothetical protein